MFDIVIVGGGIAGLTSAIYASRNGLRTLVLEKSVCGGQITQADRVENYPAFASISGMELSERLEQQALASGADIRMEEVLAVFQDQSVVTTSQSYQAKAVILANGVVRRKLDVPGEARFVGKGVSYCAHCDGRLYRGCEVAIVGGGNLALHDALYLSNLCSKVHLIHRRQDFRAEARLQEAVLQRSNIEIHRNCRVTEILGDECVKKLRLDASTKPLEVEAVFVAIGYLPDNRMLGNLPVVDAEGYIAADARCKTALPWLFAAGDTRNKTLRQLVTAASDGAIAASEAANYLSKISSLR